MMSFTMPHEVLRAYSSPFPERENGDAEPVTFSLDDLREENLSPETKVASSDIFLLRHIFGSENELVFSVDNGRKMDFKLDGSDAIWQVERTLDIAERFDYRWAPKRRVNIAVVGIMHELIPLFDAITGAAKEAIQDGEIGPSSVALLRRWFDDHHASDPQGGFFTHVDLPVDCSWADFKAHYTTRKRIDHRRHVEDLLSYPPIAEALAGAA